MAFDLDLQLISDFVEIETSPLQALWARVNAQAAELDPLAAAYDTKIRELNPKHQNGFMAASQKVIWVCSLKVPARSIRSGRISSCPPLLAAQLMVGGTHRLANAEEIQSWHDEQQRRKDAARALELSKNPPPPTQQIIMTAEAVKAMQAPTQDQKGRQQPPRAGEQS